MFNFFISKPKLTIPDLQKAVRSWWQSGDKSEDRLQNLKDGKIIQGYEFSILENDTTDEGRKHFLIAKKKNDDNLIIFDYPYRNYEPDGTLNDRLTFDLNQSTGGKLKSRRNRKSKKTRKSRKTRRKSKRTSRR